MSVSDINPLAPAGSTGSPATAAGAAPAPAASPVMGLAQILSYGISRNPASEALALAGEKVTAVLKENAGAIQGIRIASMRIDATTHPDLLAPAIVLLAVDEQRRTFGYHVALLEAGAAILEPETKTYAQGLTITEERYFERIYNRTYHNAVLASIQQVMPDYIIAAGGGTASRIPASFDWNDAAAVRSALLTMLQIAACDLMIETGVLPPVNLAELNDARINVRYAFGRSAEKNVMGDPVRADLVIDTSVNFRPNNRAAELNEGNGSIRLARTTGYINMAWAGARDSGNGAWGAPTQSTQRFIPQVVVTMAESQNIFTPEVTLASTLVAALALREGTNWFPYFRSGLSGLNRSGSDPRDVGALNIEANLERSSTTYGAVVDTKSNTWGDVDLGKFLSAVCYPETIFSIDVPVLGIERAGGGEMFIMAAQGERAAQQAILNAANNLTGGRFQSCYAGGEPVIVDEEMVLLGTYQNDAGQLADVRDIDYLAVMNLVGKTDPSVGAAWAKATTDYTSPLEVRLERQRRIIQQVVGNGSVKFTGTARRVTLSGDFVMAFATALKAANVQIVVNNPGQGADFSGARPMMPWMDRARIGNAPSGAFQMGGYANNGQAYAGQQAFNGIGKRY